MRDAAEPLAAEPGKEEPIVGARNFSGPHFRATRWSWRRTLSPGAWRCAAMSSATLIGQIALASAQAYGAHSLDSPALLDHHTSCRASSGTQRINTRAAEVLGAGILEKAASKNPDPVAKSRDKEAAFDSVLAATKRTDEMELAARDARRDSFTCVCEVVTASREAGLAGLEQNAGCLNHRIGSISLFSHHFCRKPVPTFGSDALYYRIASARKPVPTFGSDALAPGSVGPDDAAQWPPPLREADLVVTAHRRPQSRRELNLSVSGLDSETLDRIQADHPSEALNRLAGVNIQRGNGVEHLTAIRSPVLTAGAGAGSFLFLEDNVPLRSAGFANVNVLAEAHTEIARRIEVVKGPSGAQYGANAIHGVVNVISPNAPARGSLAQVNLGADTDGRLKAEAKLGVRLPGGGPGADQGFTIALSLGHEDGFQEPSGLDQQKLSLVWELNRANWRAQTNLAFVNINQETAGFIQGDDAYRDRALRAINPVPEAYRDAKSVRLQTAFAWDLTPKITLAITPFLRWNEQDFVLSFLPSRARERNGHWSVGEQAALAWRSPLGLAWTLGFDSEYTEGYLTEFQTLPSLGSFTRGLHYDYSVRAISASPFAQLDVPLAKSWRAEFAARLDWTFYDYDNRTASNDIGRFRRPADSRDAFFTVSPKFGLVYEWSPSQHLYARLAQGARPPQTSDLYRLQTQQNFGEIRPERITSLELGWRANWSPLTLDLAAFGARKRQFYFRDADGFNVPDGRTQHVGVEIEGQVRLPLGLDVAASATYARHTYRFTRLVRGDQSENIVAGSDIDTAPRTLANLALSWRSDQISAPRAAIIRGLETNSARAFGPYWEWELEWAHEARYFTDAANRNVYPGHNLGNFRLQWHGAQGLAVGFTIRNLAGKLYAERADFAFQTERFFPGERRVFAVNLRWDFADVERRRPRRGNRMTRRLF